MLGTSSTDKEGDEARLLPLFGSATCEYLGTRGDAERLSLIARHQHNENQQTSFSETVFTNAAKYGHLTLLQWLYQQGHPHNALVAAYETVQHLITLEACDIDAATPETKRACTSLRAVLQWFREERIASWHIWLCGIASLKGHLDVLRWGVANECLLDREDCARSARLNNHADIEAWLDTYK